MVNNNLILTSATNFENSQETRDNWEFIRQLRTDPRNAEGFINQNPITPEQQISYSKKHKHDYWICWKETKLDDGKMILEHVGFAGIVDGDIRVCTAHNHKKQGIGKWMINTLSRTHEKIFAKIKLDNVASQRLFESCGYKLKYYIYEKE